MAEIARRLDRLEKLLGAADCDCQSQANEIRCIVVEPEWSDEQIRIADDAARFTCPSHGLRRPMIVHLSPTDALL
jgi:hypothetical protein